MADRFARLAWGLTLASGLAGGATGCASLDDDVPPPYVPSTGSYGTGSYGTGARSLGAELGLRAHEDQATNTLVLEGDAGRIVFVEGTRTVMVAGERLTASSILRRTSGDILLAKEDAVRISTAWQKAGTRFEAKVVVPAAPSSAPVGRGDTPVSDPEWRVPLKRTWEGILIHHSATDSGNLAKFDRYHREVNGWLMVGYDFIICNGSGGPDGLVETSDRWKRQIQGAHAGPGLKRYNDHWVGICLVGDFSRTRPTDRQLASLRRLIRYLQNECGIPDGNVRGHRDVRDTECPGKLFPHGEFEGGAPRAW